MKSLLSRIILAFSLALTALLAGCGTPYATVKNNAGDPVMLLGYDPVAYFTQGKPVKGSPEHQVKLPERSYYFSSLENKKLFEANAAKYEPQYGGFCSSGAAFAIKARQRPPPHGKSTTAASSSSAMCSAMKPGKSIPHGMLATVIASGQRSRAKAGAVHRWPATPAKCRITKPALKSKPNGKTQSRQIMACLQSRWHGQQSFSQKPRLARR
ncbi:MAG: hypothetical protein HC765_16215 [Brachymonas sp.]|nr:hypothetical protein [Brachymonas sp.]